MACIQQCSNSPTVNHFINFVDLTTRVLTQHVESYWNRLKDMRGCHLQQLPGSTCGGKGMEKTERRHYSKHCPAIPSLVHFLFKVHHVPYGLRHLCTLLLANNFYCNIHPRVNPWVLHQKGSGQHTERLSLLWISKYLLWRQPCVVRCIVVAHALRNRYVTIV